MTGVGVKGMARALAASPVPVTMTLTVQAWAGDKPYENVTPEGPVFSPLTTVVVHADGRITKDDSRGPVVELVLTPTDGAFCYRWGAKRGSDEFPARFTELPDVEQIQFGELQQVDPASFEPVEDVLDAWDTVRADTYRARDDSLTAARVAEGHARDAAGSAGAAAGSAGSAASSAGDAAGSAGSAAGSAGNAAGFAGAASESAGQASGAAGRAGDSASAAAESERKAGLSASAAATSESNASTHAGTASTKANEASTSASTASTKAGEAADSASSAGQSKATAEQIVQTATFLFVQQGDQPASALNLADVKTNALIHRRLTGNITGITLPTVPTPGQMITLVLTQDATGGRTLTTPAAILGHEGMDPTLSTLPNSVDMIGLLYDGVRWWSFVTAQRGL